MDEEVNKKRVFLITDIWTQSSLIQSICKQLEENQQKAIVILTNDINKCVSFTIRYLEGVIFEKPLGKPTARNKELELDLNEADTVLNLSNYKVKSEVQPFLIIELLESLRELKLCGKPIELFCSFLVKRQEGSVTINTSIRSHYSLGKTYSRIVLNAFNLYCQLPTSWEALNAVSKLSHSDIASEAGKCGLDEYLLAIYLRWKAKKESTELWGIGVGSFIDLNVQPEILIYPRKKDRLWADPMVMKSGDNIFIFVEELLTGATRGIIVCLEFDFNFNFLKRHSVLEEPFHLSYPQLFEFEGELLMLPETSENRSITLYKCVSFPDEWEKLKDLKTNVNAKDSTLFNSGDRWYMFTTIENNDAEGLSNMSRLFYADSPLSLKWKEVTQSPFSFVVGNSRSAGPIFNYEGSLYRPVQNSSIRYGYGININRLDSLDEEEVQQHNVSFISPPEFSISIHTFSWNNSKVFFDFLYTKPIKESSRYRIIEVEV